MEPKLKVIKNMALDSLGKAIKVITVFLIIVLGIFSLAVFAYNKFLVPALGLSLFKLFN